ncbi:MAG: hypothetical protein B7Z23_13720 [Pseudomonadales bacterium 32-61-5]|nr:MAG: hypothetical protein B7Z23_13720 [Pseudomonadales bacterium 32-61-5]
MSEITYNYEIISVDATAKCMEVVYSSEGRQTMHIGARLPFAGETIEGIVKTYAPVRYWQEQEAAVIVPEVGATGTVAPSVPQPPTPEQIRLLFERAIQKRLDDFARTRGYDNMLSVCTYAADPDPRFATEGQYCITVRGATWAVAYQILADVTNGIRSMPSSPEDIFPELPTLTWPV